MTYPRFVFGIMQCVLALLLLAGGPNQAHPSYQTAIQLSFAGADLVISGAQAHKGALRSEADHSLGTKRSHWPTPKALVPIQTEGSTGANFVAVALCAPPALYVDRYRPCAAPPTGPPSS